MSDEQSIENENISEGGNECSVKNIDESSDSNIYESSDEERSVKKIDECSDCNIYGSSDEERSEKENNQVDITSLNTMMNTRSNRRTRNERRISLECSNLMDHYKGDAVSESSNSERNDDGYEDNSEYNPSDEYGSGDEKSKVSGVYIFMMFIY